MQIRHQKDATANTEFVGTIQSTDRTDVTAWTTLFHHTLLRQNGIHCENLRSTLARVVQTHFDIVLDLVLRDEVQIDACLNVLRGRPTYVVRVWAPLDVLEERERSRDDRAPGMAREQVDHPAYRRAYDVEVDTSLCTPEEGAAAVRRLIGSI